MRSEEKVGRSKGASLFFFFFFALLFFFFFFFDPDLLSLPRRLSLSDFRKQLFRFSFWLMFLQSCVSRLSFLKIAFVFWRERTKWKKTPSSSFLSPLPPSASSPLPTTTTRRTAGPGSPSPRPTWSPSARRPCSSPGRAGPRPGRWGSATGRAATTSPRARASSRAPRRCGPVVCFLFFFIRDL